MSGSLEPRRGVLEAFRQGLRDLGYSEGQNIVIEHRFSGGREEGTGQGNGSEGMEDMPEGR
jgi:hypothetical protein